MMSLFPSTLFNHIEGVGRESLGAVTQLSYVKKIIQCRYDVLIIWNQRAPLYGLFNSEVAFWTPNAIYQICRISTSMPARLSILKWVSPASSMRNWATDCTRGDPVYRHNSFTFTQSKCCRWGFQEWDDLQTGPTFNSPVTVWKEFLLWPS